MSDTLDHHEASPDAGFAKGLGLFDATMLVAGSMIGSGIYIVSADIARDVGSAGWLLVVWLVTCVMTILGALAYGELAAMMPHAGGQYVFLREAYGPLWGFLYGWTSFLVIQTGTIAAVGVGFSKFLGVLAPSLGMGPEATLYSHHLGWVIEFQLPWLEKPVTFFELQDFKIAAGHLVAVAILVFLSLWNCLGVRQGSVLQNVFTVVKTGTLIGLVVLGLTIAVNPAAIAFNREHAWDGLTLTPRFLEAFRIVPFAGLAAAMVVSGAMVGSLFSADAWNNVTFIAGEVRTPERNLPRALVLGTGFVLVLYFLANVSYLAALPVTTPVVPAQEGALERNGVSPVSERHRRGKRRPRRHGNGRDVLAQRRRPSDGDRDHDLHLRLRQRPDSLRCSTPLCDGPRRALLPARRHAQPPTRARRRPGRADDLGRAPLVFGQLQRLARLRDLRRPALLRPHRVGSLRASRVRRPEWPRPYRAFGYPLLPFIYVAAAAFIMLSLLVVRPKYSWPSFAIVLSGVPVYFLWRGLRRLQK